MPRPSPEVELGWATVTPNATLVALDHASQVDYVVDALRETWTIPMTVRATTLLPEQATALGLTDDQVSWGSVPDIALVLEYQTVGGVSHAVLVWDAQYSSVVSAFVAIGDPEWARDWGHRAAQLDWTLVATPSWPPQPPGR